MSCIHCFIEGRVQGVFYRSSAQQQANRLKLNGWIKNCLNGQVELIACGEESALREFEKWCWQGPEYAKVSKVSCKSLDYVADEANNEFTIIG